MIDVPAVQLTIGNDAGTAAGLEEMGCSHQDCPVTEHVVDAKNKIVTTPAYMLGPTIAHDEQGVAKCVAAVLEMASASRALTAAARTERSDRSAAPGRSPVAAGPA